MFESGINNRMTNSVDPDETAGYKLSHGSTLFAKISLFVCQAEMLKQAHHFVISTVVRYLAIPSGAFINGYVVLSAFVIL